MFYLTTLEENVLFKDAPNTFNLRLYGVGYMVKDHSDSERGTRRRHYMGCSFRFTANYIYMNYPTDEIVHTTVFVNSLSEDLLEREIAQWVHHEGSIRRPIAQ